MNCSTHGMAFLASGMRHLVFGAFILFAGCDCGRVTLAANAPHLEVQPLALDFGPVPVGSKAILLAEVRNSGAVPLHVEPVVSDTEDYEGPSESMTVAPGERVVISIEFSPVTEGPRLGAIHLLSDAENSQDFAIAATGIGIRLAGADAGVDGGDHEASMDGGLDGGLVADGGHVLDGGHVADGGHVPDGGLVYDGGLAVDGGPTVDYLKASNTQSSDMFGGRVALSRDGTILVVGATSEDSNGAGVNADQTDNSLYGSGAVYVFVRSGGAWTQQAYLKASNPGDGDAFGGALALSADGATLAVGAPSEASSSTGVNGNESDDGAPYSGAVYVFIRVGATWFQQAYIKASNTESMSTDWFGGSVALSADGNVLAVGADGEDSSAIGINGNQADNSAPQSGAVYVFGRNSGTWTQQAYVKPSNTTGYFRFGQVALDGDGTTLAVGAYQLWFGLSGIGPGAVYVFEKQGGAWSQVALLEASNAEADDALGTQLALSTDGRTLVASATHEDSGAPGVGGNQGDNSQEISGAVYVWRKQPIGWVQEAYLKASNPERLDYFGCSLAVSGDGQRIVVGAQEEDSGATGLNGDSTNNAAAKSGAAYLFARSGPSWVQQFYLKAPNAGAGDFFGADVALDETGRTLVVGAALEASRASGINGDQSDNSAPGAGAAYVFEW